MSIRKIDSKMIDMTGIRKEIDEKIKEIEISMKISTEEFIAEEGQIAFVLKDSYSFNTDNLSVEVGGVEQYSPENFLRSENENGELVITFHESLPKGIDVVVSYYGGVDDLNVVMDSHVNNPNIHVTSEDKEALNSIPNTILNLDTHTSNQDIHVTSGEKNIISSLSNLNIDGHINNQNIHVTSEDKELLISLSSLDTSSFGDVKSDGSVAIGNVTIGSRLTGSTVGNASFSQGLDNISSGEYSHVVGRQNVATTRYAMAKGRYNLASNGTVFTVVSVDASNKALTLNGATGMAVGTKIDIAIRGDIPLTNVNITAISGNTITVDSTSQYLKDASYVVLQATNPRPTYAEGYNSTATGTDAHAEGYRAVAIGNASHAEGYNNVASSTASHAEGYGTKSIGYYSHSEGLETVASGDSSHAEGHNSIASGDYSHAEGHTAKAEGGASHAEGSATTASGMGSHAEGFYTVASGGNSHAEGQSSVANGDNSHAEGQDTTASGLNSHAEGYGNMASGDNSHAEGASNISATGYAHTKGRYNLASNGTLYNVTNLNNTAKTITLNNVTGLTVGSKVDIKRTSLVAIENVEITAIDNLTITLNTTEAISASKYVVLRTTNTGNPSPVYAEGFNNITTGHYSHTEGSSNVASGNASHAEGNGTTASGAHSHAEGNGNTASGAQSHAEGQNTKAEGSNAHAEGISTQAKGSHSHAEGNSSKAIGNISHAEGRSTEANNEASHAEGRGTKANGLYSHAEGYETTADGEASHSEGYKSNALANYSHAQGVGTIANVYASTAIGRFNKTMSGSDMSALNDANDAFVIGNGTDASTLSNAFRVNFVGATYGLSAFNSTGADYSEYFEWSDGNIDNEDRVGYVVTMDGDKIRKATKTDSYILGITSSNPSVIGDSYQDDWKGKYLLDKWERIQYHWVDVEYDEEVLVEDENGSSIQIVKSTRRENHPIYNPNWNPNYEYIPREKRKEWSAVGLVGKILVRDDGTCKVNSFAKVGDTDGELTSSDEFTNMRVIERVSQNVVRIFIK